MRRTTLPGNHVKWPPEHHMLGPSEMPTQAAS
jgi:hypothetical protein